VHRGGTGAAQRNTPDLNRGHTSGSSRNRCLRRMCPLRNRPRVARQAHDPGGRSHQRGLERQPARKPALSVSQSSRDHEHVVQGRRPTQSQCPVE
jgi:hypothetical protein